MRIRVRKIILRIISMRLIMLLELLLRLVGMFWEFELCLVRFLGDLMKGVMLINW